jgi:hypothetical protein
MAVDPAQHGASIGTTLVAAMEQRLAGQLGWSSWAAGRYDYAPRATEPRVYRRRHPGLYAPAAIRSSINGCHPGPSEGVPRHAAFASLRLTTETLTTQKDG